MDQRWGIRIPFANPMHTLTTAQLKARFSEVLDEVRDGETVVITYGRRKEKVAAIVPYDRIAPAEPRPLGVLEERASYHIGDDFEVDDEELLES